VTIGHCHGGLDVRAVLSGANVGKVVFLPSRIHEADESVWVKFSKRFLRSLPRRLPPPTP
jgi:hypothetical protein